MASEAVSEYLISKPFPGEASPHTPLVLHAYMHAYIQIRHLYNPPSTNPGYGPGLLTDQLVVTGRKSMVARCWFL